LRLTPSLLPLFLLLGPLAAYFLIRYLFQSYYRLRKRRAPFTHDCLRAPGQSSGLRINYLNEEISFYFTLLTVYPLFFYSGLFSHVYFAKRQFRAEDAALYAVAGSFFIFFFLFKTLKHLKERRNLRLGYEGQIAVGQALNQLMLAGNLVYHDFPAEKFNIDHIVVGRSGIFAVETKAQSKPASKSGDADATVAYNGKMLSFPNEDDFKTIEQAEKQADWLSNWISNATGEPVAARAIVALPGWFVKRTSADGISVVNPKQFPALFKNIKPRLLSDQMIGRIVDQLEQKCRDGVPGANAPGGEQSSAPQPF
jgi:hypothetical protein